MKTKRDFLDLISKHILSISDFRSPALWEEICNAFPEYVAHFTAFKAVSDTDKLNKEMIRSPYKSWAKSLQGIRHYLNCGEYYDINEDPGFFLIEAEISAFDVSKFIQDAINQGYELNQPIIRMGKKEEELICVEVYTVKSQKTVSYFELFLQG